LKRNELYLTYHYDKYTAMEPNGTIGKGQPWSSADATDYLRKLAKDPKLKLHMTKHAREQMQARDLYVGDVLYVLKNGFVYEQPERATQPGCFKYKIESSSPAGMRTVRIVVIPWVNPPEVKIVTVMWRDEPGQF
jgi:Domain of unknown function (DUF4258)